MYKRTYPSISLELNHPDIIAAVIKNFSTNQAFWHPYFQVVFQRFASLKDPEIPESDWIKEVIDNLYITVELPMPSVHSNIFKWVDKPSDS